MGVVVSARRIAATPFRPAIADRRFRCDTGDMCAQHVSNGNGEAIEFARRFVAIRHVDAGAAFLAGSQAGANASASSDFDIVLLFDSLPQGAWREMTEFEGRAVEVFAHDPSTLAYFCWQIDRPSGIPALPDMVGAGIIVAGAEDDELVKQARRLADEVLNARPPPLDDQALEMRRFALTELANALQPDRPDDSLCAAGAALYTSLGDFALRAAGCWSASGKALPKALAKMDAELSREFANAFEALFTRSDTAPVQALVARVLKPYGGPLRVGFRLSAPADWRQDIASPEVRSVE